MECPKCGLVNIEFAQICDCGYNFETKEGGNRVLIKIGLSLVVFIVGAFMAGIGNSVVGRGLFVIISSVVVIFYYIWRNSASL